MQQSKECKKVRNGKKKQENTVNRKYKYMDKISPNIPMLKITVIW